MAFWLFCGAMNVLIPAVMLLLGTRFQKHPPKKINHIYGYRTSRSMRSQETWKFAHETYGKLWVRLGAVLLVLAVLASVLTFRRGIEAAGVVSAVVVTIQTLALIGSIFPVERALKRKFG